MSETHPETRGDFASTTNGTLDLVTKAIQEGASDAGEAASRTLSATSRLATRLVYTAFYTISYGVVFPLCCLPGRFRGTMPPCEG